MRQDEPIVERAQELLAVGKLDEANDLLISLVKQMPADWKPIQVVRGDGFDQVRVASWDLEEYQAWSDAWAEQDPQHQIAVWVRPSYSCAFYQLAHIAAEREDDVAALDAVERGLALEPDHPLLLCEKGFVLGRMQRYEEALACYQQAFDARSWSPNFQKAQALRGVGTTLIDLDRLETAEAALERSLEFEPNSEAAHNELAYIAQLRSHKKPHRAEGLKTNMKTRSKREDEIRSSGTFIQVGGLFGRPSKGQPESHAETASEAPAVTGFDYASQWPEELEIIHAQGPLSPEELTQLSTEQVADYYYVTSWILRQEGEQAFIALREELRGIILRRLERDLPLKP
jgi:tetratricopeptide (TPR) repeat protein